MNLPHHIEGSLDPCAAANCDHFCNAGRCSCSPGYRCTVSETQPSSKSHNVFLPNDVCLRALDRPSPLMDTTITCLETKWNSVQAANYKERLNTTLEQFY
ncbi:hypothetical protein NPIL_207561 [Nephila pilipes]|uniref:Uncharacterized protein n=1 Tax=Nephila pilipes TaxID=299642 RepID=A0A8X6USU0_NEPPI|nr:hypothetical protein NPIL_207561 [Nephila pilipes]